MNPNADLITNYIDENIIPRYKDFDKGHDVSHVQTVREKSRKIALHLIEQGKSIDLLVVDVVAAFHDLGLIMGREGHEKLSAAILRDDGMIRQEFSEWMIDIMAEAIEDHRASNAHEPRSIYGKIVSDGDRTINYEDYMRRVVVYRMKNFINSKQEAFLESIAHLKEKYGKGGYLKLYLDFGNDAIELKRIQQRLECPMEELYKDFDRVWEQEKKLLNL